MCLRVIFTVLCICFFYLSVSAISYLHAWHIACRRSHHTSPCIIISKFKWTIIEWAESGTDEREPSQFWPAMLLSWHPSPSALAWVAKLEVVLTVGWCSLAPRPRESSYNTSQLCSGPNWLLTACSFKKKKRSENYPWLPLSSATPAYLQNRTKKTFSSYSSILSYCWNSGFTPWKPVLLKYCFYTTTHHNRSKCLELLTYCCQGRYKVWFPVCWM